MKKILMLVAIAALLVPALALGKDMNTIPATALGEITMIVSAGENGIQELPWAGESDDTLISGSSTITLPVVGRLTCDDITTFSYTMPNGDEVMVWFGADLSEGSSGQIMMVAFKEMMDDSTRPLMFTFAAADLTGPAVGEFTYTVSEVNSNNQYTIKIKFTATGELSFMTHLPK